MKKFRVLTAAIIASSLLLCGCNLTDYSKAQKAYKAGEYEKASELFTSLGDYKDSKDMIQACQYNQASELMLDEKYNEAYLLFSEVTDYKDSADLSLYCRYNYAIDLMKNEDYLSACDIFSELGEYEDSSKLSEECVYDLGADAFDKGNWSEAEKYLTDISYYPEGMTSVSDLLLLSRAHRAFDNEDYQTVLQLMDEYPDRLNEKIYNDSALYYFQDCWADTTSVYDCDTAILVTKDYLNRSNQEASVTSYLEESFTTLIKSEVYDVFPYMDKIVYGLKDTVDCSRLSKLLEESTIERIESFLIGKWLRSDDTTLNGAILEVVKSDDELIGIMRDFTNCTNFVAFEPGDIKWKNIAVISNSEFGLHDLTKNYDSNTYEILDARYQSAVAQIDFTNNSLSIHVTNENVDIPGYYTEAFIGSDQVWIRQTE